MLLCPFYHFLLIFSFLVCLALFPCCLGLSPFMYLRVSACACGTLELPLQDWFQIEQLGSKDGEAEWT